MNSFVSGYRDLCGFNHKAAAAELLATSPARLQNRSRGSTLALGDFGVKLAIALFALLPFRFALALVRPGA